MAGKISLAFAFIVAMTSPALTQPVKSDIPLAAARQARLIQLAKIVVNIKRGDVIGSAKYARFCLWDEDIQWRTGPLEVDITEFEAIFRDELKDQGFSVAGDPSNLFNDPNENPAEYLVGGSIDKIDMHVCYRHVNIKETNYETSSGTASIDVEWQIYSQLERRVVATFRTTGKSFRPKSKAGGALGLVFDAFGDAAAQLVRDEQFGNAFAGPAIDMSVARKPQAELAPLRITSMSDAPTSLAKVVASTALILTNGGEGSGFLISPDGYVLTNHHVIAGSPYVKLRWSDGTEVLGEVLRSDKLRDIAVIKTDPKGRNPLHLRTQPVTIGEDIYAVGAPTGAKFQNTVTKGIVSATRVFNGFNFIQSDVGVTHGNSGGPIVDANGEVVGLTDLGRTDAPMVNLFIPIDEALSFLGIQMTPAGRK